jgi:DNA-binding helix-hairpin-helix protein with protein kinase domain
MFQEERRRVLDELATARSEYDQFKLSFERDRTQMLGNAERNQLHEYLRQFRIEDAVIASIGRNRKAILLACGLETALDIHRASLAALRGQGFGPDLQGKLLNWRASVEVPFKFEPARLVLPEKLRTLHARHQPRRVQLQGKLEAGPHRLRAIADRARMRLAELQSRTSLLVPKLAQAEADLAAMDV